MFYIRKLIDEPNASPFVSGRHAPKFLIGRISYGGERGHTQSMRRGVA
jgi:hypothetical protein